MHNADLVAFALHRRLAWRAATPRALWAAMTLSFEQPDQHLSKILPQA
jgi:hypothetical protein